MAWSKLFCFAVLPSLCLSVTHPSSQRSALFCTKEKPQAVSTWTSLQNSYTDPLHFCLTLPSVSLLSWSLLPGHLPAHISDPLLHISLSPLFSVLFPLLFLPLSHLSQSYISFPLVYFGLQQFLCQAPFSTSFQGWWEKSSVVWWPHANPRASPLPTSALGSTTHADCCRRNCDLRDNDNIVQRSYPVVQEWQEIFCVLILSSKGINAFHLSVGISPNEEHWCMWWTLSTYIQLTLVGFPTSHTSAHVQMPVGSRANTDTILSQLKSHFHQLLKTAKGQLWLQYRLAEFKGGKTKPRGGFVLLWQHQEWKQ